MMMSPDHNGKCNTDARDVQIPTVQRASATPSPGSVPGVTGWDRRCLGQVARSRVLAGGQSRISPPGWQLRQKLVKWPRAVISEMVPPQTWHA